MKHVTFLAKVMCIVSVVLLTACASASASQKKKGGDPFGEVIARPGQSEIVVENTMSVPIEILVNGKLEGAVKANSADRIVVPDGNHQIKVRHAGKTGGAASRDVQFYTQAKRFFFKATGPKNAKSMYLERENAYDITVPNNAQGSGNMSVAQASGDVPLASTGLGQDKAAMFGRLDAQLGASSSPAPAASASAPQTRTQAAPAAAPVPAAQQGANPTIAVYVTGDRNDSERRALSAELLSALVKSGQYTVVERSEEFLSTLDREHVKQRDGSVNDSQISALGKQFGVRYICIVNIAQAYSANHISARIVDVETAQIISTGKGDSPLRNMDDLNVVSFKVARELLKQ